MQNSTKFTLGLVLLAGALLMGGFMYLEQKQTIQQKKSALRDAEFQVVQSRQAGDKIALLKDISMVQGDDQKLRIERDLKIGAPGLEFRFVGSAKYANSQKSAWRYTFRISGASTFDEATRVFNRVTQTPGFAPYKFCYGCTRLPEDAEAGLQMTHIEGYLYVYDPTRL